MARGSNFAFLLVLLVAAAGVLRTEALLQTRSDARTSGINSLEELDSEGPLQRLVRIRAGNQQFRDNTSACQRSTIGLLVGCAKQYTYLVNTFGQFGTGRLFPPGLTEDMLTPEFLDSMPLPPSKRCCDNAKVFQKNFCACREETILSFRNWGFFDPLLTLPFANFLYGEQCGAETFLADQCPNGNPFNTVGG
ncbi:hypothetical protein BSKO_10654 [Bryopsis sp. KO-2023]|nr:hypothetical protein BSKO_10654 [Bryopsis sp. KO-2023]